MRRRRHSGALAGWLAATLLAAVVGAALLFLEPRLDMVAPNVLGSVPAQTAIGLASPVAPTEATATVTRLMPTASAVPIPEVPTVSPTPTRPRPSAAEAVGRYLRAWEQQRYPAMYELLSAGARQLITESRFVARYQNITLGATITDLKATPATLVEPDATTQRVEARFTVRFQAARLDEFSEENSLAVVFEDGAWRVDWTPALIFRELTPDRQVRFIPDNPVRGAILDRNGVALAAQGKIVTLGFVPGRVKNRDLAIQELAKVLAMDPRVVQRKFETAQPDWWVPLRDFPLERRDEFVKRFASVEGVQVEEKDGRVYPQGAVAAHVVGFVSPVIADDLKTLSRKGYEEGDLVGRAGVERSMEETLAGVRGGRLEIVGDGGEIARVVAERPAKNGGTVKLTLDLDVQKKVETILGDRVGSLVLMDPRDNGILAMVSRPSYDPNGFIFGLSDEDWKKLADDPRRPFQPRANLSAYATGSVFKVITMAAGLEKGGFQPNTSFDCASTWTVPGSNIVMKDWAPNPQGRMDYVTGLVTSCNPVWYQVGYELNKRNPSLLPDFARQFGLGEPTGVRGFSEAAGTVPSPEWKKKELRQEWFPGDAVNLAIGQGYLQATPLQVANVYTTLANGGVLRTPLLVGSITPGDGRPTERFQAEQRWRVPVSGENLAVIREAMKRVASSPRGTGNYAFAGYRIPIAAKTGSAENEGPDAHAWFAGYGPADQPTLVVVVMLEGGKLGGQFAAPLGRQAFAAVLGA